MRATPSTFFIFVDVLGSKTGEVFLTSGFYNFFLRKQNLYVHHERYKFSFQTIISL